MKFIGWFFIAFALICFSACKPQQNYGHLYTMNDFRVNAGNAFVKEVSNLDSIQYISIVDTRADGNEFKVNGKNIFLDTLQINQPNYYNYRKLALELGIVPDSLLNCLKSFHQTGANEYSRQSDFALFQVTVGFTKIRGYIYTSHHGINQGDTLTATSAKNREYNYHVVLTKQIKDNWYEYVQVD